MPVPANPPLDARDVADAIAARRTPGPEYLGAMLGEGFWTSLPGQMAAEWRVAEADRGREITDAEIQRAAGIRGANRLPADPPRPDALSEETWRASPHFRAGLRWDEAMTPDRAAALAEIHDENAYRRWLIAQRQAGALDTALGFGAAMLGGAPDPVNFIPFAGPSFRAAAAARYGTVAGRALVSSGEAALGNALASPLVAVSRAAFGDDVAFADILTDIAMGAAIGFAFGGAVGAWVRFRGAAPSVPMQTQAGAALSEGAADIAAGVPINVNSAAAREARALAAAYDAVRAQPRGDPLDPLVRLEPEGLDALIVARGGFRNVNELEISRAGWGLVKVIWRHGAESDRPPSLQVRREDITALPQIVRDFEPIRDPRGEEGRRTWVVDRDGRRVVYGTNLMQGGPAQGLDTVVTIHAVDPSRPNQPPLSDRRTGARRASPSEVSRPAEDTAAAGAEPDRQGRAGVPAQPNIGARRRRGNPAAEPSLVELLARRGLRDDGGDLKAIGAHQWHAARPGRPRLVRDDGIPLDQARELATELGYIGRGGEIDGNQTTTVADLVAAIDAELRGAKVYPAGSPVAEAAELARLAALDRAAMERAADERGIATAGLSDDELRARLIAHDERAAAATDRAERAAVRDELAGRLTPRAADDFDIPFDHVFAETPDPAAARAIAAAEAEAPRPARTLDDKLRAAGLDPEDIAATQADLQAIAGRMTPEDRAAIAAADVEAKSLEAQADALERAALCPF